MIDKKESVKRKYSFKKDSFYTFLFEFDDGSE